MVRRRLCRGWAKGYGYPASMSESPEWGLSMPDRAGGVKEIDAVIWSPDGWYKEAGPHTYLARFPSNSRRTVLTSSNTSSLDTSPFRTSTRRRASCS